MSHSNIPEANIPLPITRTQSTSSSQPSRTPQSTTVTRLRTRYEQIKLFYLHKTFRTMLQAWPDHERLPRVKESRMIPNDFVPIIMELPDNLHYLIEMINNYFDPMFQRYPEDLSNPINFYRQQYFDVWRIMFNDYQNNGRGFPSFSIEHKAKIKYYLDDNLMKETDIVKIFQDDDLLLTDNTNYLHWETRIKQIIGLMNKDRLTTMPDTTKPDEVKENKAIVVGICGRLDKSIFLSMQTIIEKNNIKELLEALSKHYRVKTAAKLSTLKGEFHNIGKKKLKLEASIHEVQRVYNELIQLGSKPTDEDYMAEISNAVPSNYRSTITNIETNKELLTSAGQTVTITPDNIIEALCKENAT